LKSYLNPLFEDDEEIISIEVSRQISPKVNSEPSIDDMSFSPKGKDEDPNATFTSSEVVKCDFLTTNGDPITPPSTIPTKEDLTNEKVEKHEKKMSKKQDCTAMSSAEAEYVALSASCAQVMWMRTQLQDYGFNYNKIPLYCDSQSAIAISCNPVQHSRTKHIHTWYHFIKEHVENGIIKLYFVRTEYQLADMFTKALSEDRFQYLIRRIGMRCLTPTELEVLTKESA
ncbi:hypothetical protein Tco_0741979, partial [Tanacetum coccineum]